MWKPLKVIILATGIMAGTTHANADGHHGGNDGANSTLAKTFDECNSEVGYGDEGVAPGCECVNWQEGLPIPPGCNIANEETMSNLMRETQHLAAGILWLLGKAQILMILLASGSLLALCAAAYFGTFNVQWLSITALLMVVGAGATSIVSFLGSGFDDNEQENLWDVNSTLELTTTTETTQLKPIREVDIRGVE